MAHGRGIYKYIAAEHILIAYMLASGLGIPTRTQYIERRIAKSLGAETYESTTCLTNKTSQGYEIQEAIQSQSSMWMLYITICAQFPVMFMSNIWGALSDRYGRHIACAMPCIGLMINCVISALTVVFELPLAVFLAGSFILGICGDLTTLVVGCAGYISDVTIPGSKERAARFVLIDVAYTLSTSIIEFAIGYVISAYGFAAPFYIGMIMISICACFVIFCLPDRRNYITRDSNSAVNQGINSDQDKVEKNPLNIVRNVYYLFRQTPGSRDGRGWRLGAYNFIISAYIMLIVANSVISVLYTTGEPFCLTPVQEGHYGATMFAIYTAGTLLAGTVLQRFVSSFWIMHLTSVSVIASVVVLALARTPLSLYISLTVGMFTYVAIPLSRNNMANLVGPDEQGVLFAFSGCLAGVAALSAPLIFNAVYSSTLGFMSGFVYLLMGLLEGIVWLVIMILHVKEPAVISQQYQPLESDDLASDCPELKDDSETHDDDDDDGTSGRI